MELLALYKRPMRSLEDLEKEVSKLKEELMSVSNPFCVV